MDSQALDEANRFTIRLIRTDVPAFRIVELFNDEGLDELLLLLFNKTC
jgi:hypothetical protein